MRCAGMGRGDYACCMRNLIASLIFATACTAPSKFQSTVAPPGPPPPSGDGEVSFRVAPQNIEIRHDVIRLKPGITIEFATDSDRILPASQPIVDEVAMVMRENPHLVLRVEGHTDNTGTPDHNQGLSDRRSASVVSYLEAKGISADRLASLGCGENVPVATNATEEGKLENRRVEFVIVSNHHPRGNCELYAPSTQAMK